MIAGHTVVKIKYVWRVYRDFASTRMVDEFRCLQVCSGSEEKVIRKVDCKDVENIRIGYRQPGAHAVGDVGVGSEVGRID